MIRWRPKLRGTGVHCVT